MIIFFKAAFLWQQPGDWDYIKRVGGVLGYEAVDGRHGELSGLKQKMRS